MSERLPIDFCWIKDAACFKTATETVPFESESAFAKALDGGLDWELSCWANMVENNSFVITSATLLKQTLRWFEIHCTKAEMTQKKNLFFLHNGGVQGTILSSILEKWSALKVARSTFQGTGSLFFLDLVI